MSPERRAGIVKLLEESAKGFRAAVAEVPHEQVVLSPGPDRWSVFQIVEHVAIAENGMFRMLSAAKTVESSLEDAAKEAFIAARADNRDARFEAPERAQPTGRFADLSQALNRFAEARQKTIQFARETELDLYFVSAVHPGFGPVNGYELLMIMAGHARRHTHQIGETVRSLV
jgi:hypothetical protein